MAGGARACLGQIGAPHGVRGEVRLRSFTSDPQSIAAYGPLETEDGRVVQIEALRPAKDHFVAALTGVRDRDAAERLTNVKLYVPRERLPQPEEADEFYHADLIGLAAIGRDEQRLGTVIAVHNFGAGDLLEVRANEGGETELIAFNETNVPAVDIEAGRIVIAATPLAADDGEAKPSRVRRPANEHPAAGSRRQRSTPSRKRRG
ncbi:MAG: ribosome maturation factor RimM [Xanthobacteraceae bacterium]